MKDTMVTIREFVEAATRSRKYPENTARAIRVALKLFEAELKDDEKTSIEMFQKNLDQIYQAVFEKNKTKYSAGSLNTYRKRVSKVLGDYFTYGTDPAKLNSWSPTLRKTTPGVAKDEAVKTKKTTKIEEDPGNGEGYTGARLDWPLANGRKAVLILPADLTISEAKIIQSLVSLRVNEAVVGDFVNNKEEEV